MVEIFRKRDAYNTQLSYYYPSICIISVLLLDRKAYFSTLEKKNEGQIYSPDNSLS